MKHLGIIAALPDEAACLAAQPLKVNQPVTFAPGISLCLSGMGYNNALNAAATLIKHGAEALVSWGVAGGINEELHSGDLLIASKVITSDAEFQCQSQWQEQLLVELTSTTFRVFNSSLYSDDKICATRRDKRRLFDKSGADAVDMESAAIAGLAQQMDLDFIVIRAIADEAVTTIPPAVTRHTDMLGRPKPIRFAFSCLLRPSQISSLLILGRAYKKALTTLQTVTPDLKSRHFLYNTPA